MKNFKCKLCSHKPFKMAMHLGRHMTTIHAKGVTSPTRKKGVVKNKTERRVTINVEGVSNPKQHLFVAGEKYEDMTHKKENKVQNSFVLRKLNSTVTIPETNVIELRKALVNLLEKLNLVF